MTTGPAERIRHDDGSVTMVWRRAFPDPPRDVWSAVTESERLARWIGTWSGTPRVGGTVAFTMTGEVDAGGEIDEPADVTILACDPPRHLAVEMPAGAPDARWHLELTVEEDGDGAVLVFAQRLLDESAADDLDAGWRWYLDRLDASLHGWAMPVWEDYAPPPPR